MKKTINKLLKGFMILPLFLLVGCNKANNDNIHLLTREQGSGTRGAFIEIFKIEEKNENGEKIDMTSPNAEETNSTSVMITTVATNPSAIGYISLGSMNEDVKAVKIDGAAASKENVKNGTYLVTRPFNIVVKEGLSSEAQDFVNFILSTQGQSIVEEMGYVSVDQTKDYVQENVSGKVVVAGSSSVTPVMQKLQEVYMKMNKNVKVEVQQSDSTTGINNAIEGICDIGMSSREVKESEMNKGVTSIKIAIDGIAVIVNQENELDELTSQQVYDIFTGQITKYSEVSNRE